jgi:hypothetical protein
MTTQKTYRKHSANQILDDAEITVMQGGSVEITHEGFPGYLLDRDDDGNLYIYNSCDVLVRLECGATAAAKLDALCAACEAEQVRQLKAADAKNGTTYAQYL